MKHGYGLLNYLLINVGLTVSDLKAELKRRNLPVSGAKPQLIERLKPFSESHQLSLTQHTEDSLPSGKLFYFELPAENHED